MTRLLLEGGYAVVLGLHLAALALLSAVGLARSVRGLSTPGRGALLAILAGGAFLATLAPSRPAVYFDEFFYVATARNFASTGRAEPLLQQGLPPAELRVGHFLPPYPQGWPFVLSLGVGSAQAPEAGVQEDPAWARAVPVSRVLYALLAPLLFLAAARRLPLWVAAAAALAVPALPTVLRMSGTAGAEVGALFFLALSLAALDEFVREPDGWRAGWLALSAAMVAEMRPEALLYSLGLLVVLRGRAPWLAAGLLLCLPALAVMLGHDPELAHHFEAAPRPGFTMWENRLANLGHNAGFFWTNRLWPVPLTLLALAGALRGGRVARAVFAWVVGITIFLSWFPFGDYASVNSLDTWRFAWHVAIPMAALAALGAASLTGRATVVAGALLAWALLAPWTHREWLVEPHRMEPLRDLAARASGPWVVAEAPEYFCLLRYGLGLPAVLAPVQDVPPGTVLFAVEGPGGLPDVEAWGRYDLVPIAVADSLPRAGLFEVRPR